MENLYLIVGLGNPGSDYSRTRHNVGFMVSDRLAERWGAAWDYEKKFNARIARGSVAGKRVLLCQPQTYMNSSGEAVQAVLAFFRIAIDRLLVVVDDADLPLGELRLRPGGGAGGHHGLESIETCLGTARYARLRVGIGRQDGSRQITNYVLGRFSSTEVDALGTVLKVAADQAASWLDDGIQKAMSRFNGVVPDSGNERKVK